MGTRARTGRSGPGVVAAAVLLVVTAAALAGPATAAPSTASRSLFDDDSGTALFGAGSDLAPGTPVAACISVGTAQARAGDAVRVAATDVAGPLAPYLTLTVEMGTGGSFGDCSGFVGSTVWTGTLADLAAASVGDGVETGWEPARTATRSFRVTAEIADVPAAEGLSSTGRFAWRLFEGPPDPPAPPPSTSPSTSPSPSPTDSPSPTPTDSPSPTDSPTPTLTQSPTPTATPTTTPPTTRPPTRPTQPTTDPTTTRPAPDPGPGTRPPEDPSTTATEVPGPPGTGGDPGDGTATVSPPDEPVDPAPGTDVPTGPTSGPSPAPAPGEPTGSPGPLGPDGTPAPPGVGGAGGGSGGTPREEAGQKPDVVLGVPVTRIQETARRATQAALSVVGSPQYPLTAVLLAGLFLLVQDRIDRRDPKLASAPITQRDERLRFPDLFPPTPAGALAVPAPLLSRRPAGGAR